MCLLNDVCVGNNFKHPKLKKPQQKQQSYPPIQIKFRNQERSSVNPNNPNIVLDV